MLLPNDQAFGPFINLLDSSRSIETEPLCTALSHSNLSKLFPEQCPSDIIIDSTAFLCWGIRMLLWCFPTIRCPSLSQWEFEREIL